MERYYSSNTLEKYISKVYEQNAIYTPYDLDLERIASIWSIRLRYTGASRAFSQYNSDSRTSYIFLPSKAQNIDQRAAFFHELCHVLRHAGNQRIMPEAFVRLQECQAEQFIMFASMPFFMIQNFLTESPSIIAEQFQIPIIYVQKRLLYIKNQILINSELGIRYDKPRWSPETIKVLHQLNHILLNKQHYRYYGS